MEPIGKRSATQAEARALSHPLRLRIIRLCLDRPLTNGELSERLKEQPATVLYHVRTLEKNGFLVRQEERRGKRGSREIPYLSTRKSISLDLGLSHGGDVAMVDATRTELLEAGPESVLTMTRLGVRLEPRDVQRFTQRVQRLVKDLHRADGSGDERVALMVLLHRRP